MMETTAPLTARSAALGIGLSLCLSVQAEPVTYQLDPGHTWVSFEVLHFGTSTSRGRFPVKPAQIQLDEKAGTGRIEIEVDTSAPSTGVPALDTMVKGDRFFKSGEFPLARFVASGLRFDAGRPAEIAGALTLLGTTKDVTLKALRFNCYQHTMLKKEVCGGDFETRIRRSQWGMDWGQNVVADEVRLLVQVEAVRQD